MWGSLLVAAALAAAPANGASSLAATPYFRTLDASDGLPSSTVWKVAQDHDGYIWIGTADGLARYDGVDFRVYRNDPADAASLWQAPTYADVSGARGSCGMPAAAPASSSRRSPHTPAASTRAATASRSRA